MSERPIRWLPRLEVGPWGYDFPVVAGWLVKLLWLGLVVEIAIGREATR